MLIRWIILGTQVISLAPHLKNKGNSCQSSTTIVISALSQILPRHIKSLPKTEVQTSRSDPALKPHSTWNSMLMIGVCGFWLEVRIGQGQKSQRRDQRKDDRQHRAKMKARHGQIESFMGVTLSGVRRAALPGCWCHFGSCQNTRQYRREGRTKRFRPHSRNTTKRGVQGEKGFLSPDASFPQPICCRSERAVAVSMAMRGSIAHAKARALVWAAGGSPEIMEIVESVSQQTNAADTPKGIQVQQSKEDFLRLEVLSLSLHPEITMAEHAEGARVRREDTALALNNLQFYSASKG